MPKNLNVGIFKWFQAVLPGQNSFVCVFLRNKYGFQTGNATEKIIFVLILSQQREALSPSFSLDTLCRWLTDGTVLRAGLTTSLSTDSKTNTLLTSVHNDRDRTDDSDATDDANDYNRVKAFSWAKKTTRCNFHLPCYCHICPVTNVPQMPHMHHMPKLLNMDLWGKICQYICHICINYVARML